MHNALLPHPQHLNINNDYDVISLRQAVRQMARATGLGLPQQARITAAISEIARVLVLDHNSTSVTIRVVEGRRPALEVVCEASGGFERAHAGYPAHSLRFDDARALVDDASMAVNADNAVLILRMWLNH